MAKRLQSSVILVVVFCLGLAAGVAGMVWAWPGVQARFFRRQRVPPLQRLQRTLSLTPQQLTQMQTVLKGVGDLRHSIHLKYVPEYTRLCEDFAQASQQERDEYTQSPDRQKALDQIHGILTSAQWQIFQNRMMASGKSRVTQPDLCRHLRSTTPGQPQSSPPPPRPH